MAKPKTLAAYADVRHILDAALEHGGGDYVLPTHGKAVHWRHRAYTFRKMFRELHDERYEPLTMNVEDCTVVIRPVEAVGTFIPAGGAPITPPSDPEPEDDVTASLREAARLLAKKEFDDDVF